MNQPNRFYEVDADALRYAARHAGFTSYAGLACASGLTQNQVSNLSRGKAANPSASTVLQLADALGCEPADLMRPTR